MIDPTRYPCQCDSCDALHPYRCGKYIVLAIRGEDEDYDKAVFLTVEQTASLAADLRRRIESVIAQTKEPPHAP